MFNFKKLKSNFNIGGNVFNNSFKQSSPLINSNIVHKKVLYYDKKGNAPPVQFVKQVYSKLPDDEKVPVEFMTKQQYLKQYIHNQEKQDGIRFSKQEKQQYIRNELQDMKPIVSRFTTYHNPYMPPKVVFFTDSKINKQEFKHNAQHEFGHELYERVPKVRQQWNSTINKTSSPTSYGRTSIDEDFAESYALYKDKRLQDSRRQEVFNNIKVDKIGKNKWANDTYTDTRGLNFTSEKWGENEKGERLPVWEKRKVIMTPNEFLHRQHNQSQEPDFNKWVQPHKSILPLVTALQSNTDEVPIPLEEYDQYGNRKNFQEGRHRGLAAQHLGIDIPVLQIRKTVEPWDRENNNPFLNKHYNDKEQENNKWDNEKGLFTEVPYTDNTSNNLSVTGRIVDRYAESKQLPFTAWDLNDIRKRVQERQLIQLPTEEEEQNREGLYTVYDSGSDIRKDMKQAVRRIIHL